MAKNIQKKVDFHLKKGALHKEMGVKSGDKIPVEEMQQELAKAKRTGDVHLERQINFALNARKFKH